MKTKVGQLGAACVLLFTLHLHATTRYVDLNCASSAPPYTGWSTAATNIQYAIDAATDGDLILVTNGVYATGGRVVYGSLTNRVVIDKAVTVQSVNGPTLTTIMGYPIIGSAAVRCAYLTNGAALIGFTLTGGATLNSGNSVNEQSGGGVCLEPGAAIRNSILHNNLANNNGGGACGGSLFNCEITKNSAANGGGIYGGLLFNCTVVSNSAPSRALGAGTAVCTNYNSIVQFKYSSSLANYSQSTFYWSCTSPAPSGGLGNITSSPGFVDLNAGNLRLQCGSPCIDTGTNLSILITNDLRGGSRPVDGNGDGLAEFDMGAYERNPADDIRDMGIRAGYTNFALNFSVPFVAQIDGCTSNFWWDFGDGTVISNQFAVTHAWTNPGHYPVTLTAQFSLSDVTGAVTNMVEVIGPTYYVNAHNSTPAHGLPQQPTFRMPWMLAALWEGSCS